MLLRVLAQYVDAGDQAAWLGFQIKIKTNVGGGTPFITTKFDLLARSSLPSLTYWRERQHLKGTKSFGRYC